MTKGTVMSDFDFAVNSQGNDQGDRDDMLRPIGGSGLVSPVYPGSDTRTSFQLSRVNYADPMSSSLMPAFVRSRDLMTLDPDPLGERSDMWSLANGRAADSGVLGLTVFGKSFSKEDLERSEAGRRLLKIAERNRTGAKRGFLDSLTDFQWSDLPFVGMLASVGGSISDAVTVSDTMKKLQNGEAVTDEELIKTRLYMAENEYKSNGTWGAMVGDIIRAAPGFMAEFLVSGGAFSAARTALSKTFSGSIHLGMTRAAKILAREATQNLAETAVKETGKIGAQAFSDIASGAAKDKILKEVSGQLLGFMKRTPNMYKGLTDDALRSMAEARAKHEFAEMMARNAGGSMSNGLASFGQWLKGNVSRGLMDFGSWGTAESTVAFSRHSSAGRALADAVGTFLVEAPIRGSLLMAPNQFVAKPIIGAVARDDGRTVSESTLSLQQSALMSGNRSLMDAAESISFGMNLLEYVSENTGRGLGSLMSAVGLGLEKFGVKGLVRPLAKTVSATGAEIADAAEDAVYIGGKMRKWIGDIFGTREQYAERMAKERLRLTAEKLGITDAAERDALNTAILSGSTEALRPEIRTAIGDNVSKFVGDVVDEAYRKGKRDLEYKTYARYKVAKWMNDHQVGPETVMNLYDQMGYDGILGEMFEERYSDVVKGMLGLDDRAEHDFFSNLKEAIKGLYPGWDQLTAEAVGFAMPMVARAGVMRLQSAIGGEGKVREIRTHLELIDDAMRHDTSVQMSYGQYLATEKLLERRDAKEISVLERRLEEARKASETETSRQLVDEIERLKKVSARRADRHQKFVGSLNEQARANLDAIVTVPLLSNETLADDDKYARAPMINSDQAASGLVGQTAIVDFSPELARRIYEAEMPLEGETDSWYRKAAHKIVGIAGAIVTGDFSLAATNAAHWTARDMGLSNHVLNALKSGFSETYKSVWQELREATPGERVSTKSVIDETQRRFAAKARQIMSANLAAHQLRSFSDGRMKDQAIAHVAANYSEPGDDRRYNYSVDDSGNVSFYKLTRDGSSIDESTIVSADEFYNKNKKAVDRAHDRLVAATVSLLTRGLTKSDNAARRLLASVQMKTDSELLDASIYSAAMHMIGQENLVHRVRVDGRKPLAQIMRGHTVGDTNMQVVDYIASKADVSDVNPMAFESVAHSIGFKFDGTEAGLKARNDKIFRMAKLANMLTRTGVKHFSKAIVEDEEESRTSSNGVSTLRARLNKDGSYTIDLGLSPDGSPKNEIVKDSAELSKWMSSHGYSEDTARIVFTQAKVIESDDMFYMIRELGLAKNYRSLFGDRPESAIHPMFRHDADGKLLSVERAQEILRSEMVSAANGTHADKGTPERSAWERLWGENGYMAIGEKLLSDHGIKKNTVSKYSGEFSEYTPTLYTLSLNSGRLSSTSSDVFVSIDPSVSSDVTSGIVNALLMNAYAFNSRLLKNELRGTISDFLHQVDAVIDDHLDKARKDNDNGLSYSLLALRRMCTAEIDRFVENKDGRLVMQRGYGMTANGFTILASAFCLFRDRSFADSPFLRAVADIADDVRRVPAFSDFMNLVDVVLGGSGFLSEATRNATGADSSVEDQRGIQLLMTYASGDPRAFKNAVMKSSPCGLGYRRFLDLCVRRLDAMSKSGAPVISDKEKAELSGLADRAADGESPAFTHFTFLGNLIGTIKSIIESGKVPTKSVVEFLADVAEDAKAEPGNTSEQLAAINSFLSTMRRTATADKQTEEFEAAVKSAQEAEENLTEARAKLDEVTRKLAQYEQKRLERNRKARERYAAKKRVKLDDVSQEEAIAAMIPPEQLAADESTRTGILVDLETSREETNRLSRERSEAIERLTKAKTPPTVVAAFKAGDSGIIQTGLEDSTPSEEDELADEGDNNDVSFTVGSSDTGLDVPEVFSKMFDVNGSPFTMRKGHVLVEDENHLITRSQARLAVNVVVRSLASTGGDVSEAEVVARAKELFPSLVDSEVEDIVTAFRTADDLRVRRNLSWGSFAKSGVKWDFGDDTKEDDSVSSDDFNNKSLGEYNSEAVEDFLALAQRSTPETGRNLQGFLKLTKEMSRGVSSDEHMKFVRDLLNPKMREDADTQALASAYFLDTIAKFDTDEVSAHIDALLHKKGGDPVSRRAAFLLSYLSSLPTNARVKFGILCANSVAATPVHLDKESGMLGNAHRRSGGRVPESIVVDSFSKVVGMDASGASALAEGLDRAADELIKSGRLTASDLEANASAVSEVIASVFGHESPVCSALTSDMARRQWKTLPRTSSTELLKSVSLTITHSGEPAHIPILTTISSALRVLASFGGRLSRTDVASVFTAAFATGDLSHGGLRSNANTSAFTDPVMSFLSVFQDALPETIMSAEIDQQRDTKGSSVAVAPRDLIPMLSRWMYADSSTVVTVNIDGIEKKLMSFTDTCKKFFPGVTDEVIAQCRQDGTWPDDARTPICAKCISTSYNSVEIYRACKAAYDDKDAKCYWIPIYAGDHASSTLLQIPRDVNFADVYVSGGTDSGTAGSSDVTRKPVSPKGFVNHSGGAAGADTEWGVIGSKYGITSNHYWRGNKTPSGNTEISEEQFAAGVEAVNKANKTLRRRPEKYMNLLARDWTQVDNSDAVFAISDGIKGNVVEGAVWAAQMAIDSGKPLHVFDQSKGSWFRYDSGRWVPEPTPALTKNFAGVGTTKLSDSGRAAIADAYSVTFGSLPGATGSQHAGAPAQTPVPTTRVDFSAAVADTPSAARAKDLAKMRLSNAFIGFGEPNSSTERYRTEYEKAGLANNGKYGPSTVAFVSVNGTRGGASNKGLSEYQLKTYAEAIRAIMSGATLVTDGFEYSSNSKFNVGERRLREFLTLIGATAVQRTTDAGTVTVWTMSADARSVGVSAAVKSARYPRINEGDTTFAGFPVKWVSVAEMAKRGFKSFAGLHDSTIYISKELAIQKFADRAWENPVRSDKIEGLDIRIKTVEDLIQFAALHEVAHSYGAFNKKTGARELENWCNRWAVRRMGTYAEDPAAKPPVKPDFSSINDAEQRELALMQYQADVADYMLAKRNGTLPLSTPRYEAPSSVIPVEVLGLIEASAASADTAGGTSSDGLFNADGELVDLSSTFPYSREEIDKWFAEAPRVQESVATDDLRDALYRKDAMLPGSKFENYLRGMMAGVIDGAGRPLSVNDRPSADVNDTPPTDDPERFADADESRATLESARTILSNEELALWNKNGITGIPRILTASEHTDPAFHVQEIIDIIEGRKNVQRIQGFGKDRRIVDSGLSGKDFAGLYLVTKHDGLPMKRLLETKIPKLIHFSVTTLGGTKWEPGVMKYNDLLDRIGEYIKMGLDPEAVTIRIDPIVPGVTSFADVEEVVRRASEMGIKRLRFSIMDMYKNTSEHVARLGYDPVANGYDVDTNAAGGVSFHASKATQDSIADKMLELGKKYGVRFGTCAEPLVREGISREGCLSTAAVSKMLGTTIDESKSKQRLACGCFGGKMDALAWNDHCASHCVYCYARHDNDKALQYYNEDGTLKDNDFTRTSGAASTVNDLPSSTPGNRPSYEANAKAACEAVGLSLMFTDTKRSALSSLEAQGVGMIGVREVPSSVPGEAPTRQTGESRVHIVRNWKDRTGKNEALLGSTFMRGYGAKALKMMAQDPKSSTLKAHIISTYGVDLFFSKSLTVSTDAQYGEFMEGTAARAFMDYLESFRGDDDLSTDLLTDYDSYKIGPASSKALRVLVDGKEKTIMEAVFSKVFSNMVASGSLSKETYNAVVSSEGEPTDAQWKEVSDAMQKDYGGAMSPEDLDVIMGDLQVIDKVRGDRKSRLSGILPGVKVRFVSGVNGPMLDLSYQENGAMAYTVANVSHTSSVHGEPGASPRNYEVDAFTMATVLSRGGWDTTGGRSSRAVYELISNWGLLANTVYSDPAFVKALIGTSDTVRELLRNGEDPNGQNIRQELARQLWAKIRQESNLPLYGTDMPLVSCGASAQSGGLFTHATSLMQQAMMKGSELFSDDEVKFYGTERRPALCNINITNKSFRYGWFLDSEKFGESDFFKSCMADVDADLKRANTPGLSSGRRTALAIAKAFERLRDASDAARGKPSGSTEAVKVLNIRISIGSVFRDYQGRFIYDKSETSDAYKYFGFDDLFTGTQGPDGKDMFDLSAVQCEGVDLVRNDSTGRDHIFLGGTMFGLPRTPSYNGSMWLQVVRAGLPVTVRRKTVKSSTGEDVEILLPGRDGVVSPDPYTNKILGCDHDGDKTKVYMFAVNKFGRTEFALPPSASTGTKEGTPTFSANDFMSNKLVDNPYDENGGKIGVRDLYLNQVARKNAGRDGAKGFLQNYWFNEDTQTEEELPIGDARPGHYFKISDTAKQKVSNSFVRALFNMARNVPVFGTEETGSSYKVVVRRSDGPNRPRVKFLGGVASSETKAFPVFDRNSLTGEIGDKHKYSEDANISAPVLSDDGSLGTIGEPEKGSEVSAKAANAGDARAVIVSLASALHIAWASGLFHGGSLNLFGRSTTATDWLKFIYHVDGLSNATFDDIKEQICGRLGWTKEMMDTVITELLLNASYNGKLPTTDAEFAQILGRYSRNIKDKKEYYWMLKASDVTDEATTGTIRNVLCGGKRINRAELSESFGIYTTLSSNGAPYLTCDEPKGETTVIKAIVYGMHTAAERVRNHGGSRILGQLANVGSNGFHNPVAGRLYYFMTSLGYTDAGKKLTEDEAKDLAKRVSVTSSAHEFIKWSNKRGDLQAARSFAKSVNYLTADPGDPSASSKEARVYEAYGNVVAAIEDGVPPTYAGDGAMRAYLEKMHAATALAYNIGGGLQTISARAVEAALDRDDVFFPSVAEKADSINWSGQPSLRSIVAKMLVRDKVPSYDRMQLEANAQQIPYILGYYSSFSELASSVADASFATASDMNLALKHISSGVSAAIGTNGGMLECRRGIESMFSIMYEMIVSSSEFNSRNGNKAAAYLRTTNDTAYGVKKRHVVDKFTGRGRVINVRPYGKAGEGLSRIVPLFRANDQESYDRIRNLFDGMISGAYNDKKRRVQGREAATKCTKFDISTANLYYYAMELSGATPSKGLSASDMKTAALKALDGFFGVTNELPGAILAEKRLKLKNESDRRTDAQILSDLRYSKPRYRTFLDAYAAVESLEAGFGSKFKINPSTMFGQLLPMYSLVTSRTLGAPAPTSPSLMALLPKRFYSAISAAATQIDMKHPDVVSLLIGANWSPVDLEKEALARKNKNLVIHPDTGKVVADLFSTGKASSVFGSPDDISAERTALRGGDASFTEARANPSYRNTIDGLSDGLFDDLAEFAQSVSLDTMASDNGATETSEVPADFDPSVAKVAAMMGSVLGSWATVEYSGGPVFVIRGKLRGDAGVGKECVIMVDASGNTRIDTPKQCEAYARSAGYAQSLCATVDFGTVTDPVTGETRRFSAADFLALPLSVRMGLVKKYGVGGATLNKVEWSSDGKGLACLVGAIKLPAGQGTKIFHEYFHSMMRMFDQIGLLGSADYEALAKQFGKDPTGRQMFNEEAAAEAFRKWVEGNMDSLAPDTRSVFRRIFDFLKGLFESLCRGFNYTGDTADDTIFKMMVHGFAQPSTSRISELGIDSTPLASSVETTEAARIHTAVSKRFVLPRENVNVPVSHLAKVAVDQLESAVSSSSVAQGEDIESAPGFDGLDEFDVNRNLELTSRANALLAPDGHATVSELKEVLPGLAELRESMAGKLGVTISQDTGSQWFTVDEEPAEDQIPPPPSGSEEAIEKELSEEVGSVVYPRVEANDFYRVPELIAKAIENSLKEHGSWDGPLEAVVKKYRDQADSRVPSVEARDKVAIVHGIRKAMEVLNPGLSRTLSDDEIKNSIVFEASLLMFNGLERSLVKQTGARNGTDEGMRMNGRGYTGETIASSFQVSAWITSTRPVAPAALAARVRDRVHDLFAASESGASKAELKLHLDMAEKLVDMTCDVTKLMRFRYDKAMGTLNDVIGTLKAGTKRPTFDDRGFMNDIEPIDVEDPNAEFDYDNIHTHNPRSAMHLRTFLQSHQDPAVQESLKAVLSAAYQIAAMSKFYQELDVVPASLEDLVSRNQMLKRHSIPENVSIAEWLSTQAIGDSNLIDENQGLVDHLDQPYFIANNVDAWLSSLTRKSFGAIGNIGEMLMAESHEYAALKTKIADLENFYSMMFGTNVEDGGEILKILEHTGEYKMEDGVIVRKEGDTYVKFDNYNKVTCKVKMTEADLQVVDLFLKMCSAYASGQESVITGVDNIYFDSTMSDDPAFYDREKLLARYNNGRPAKQLNSVEMALVRLTKQMPESVLSSDNNGLGYYDRVVAAFVKAIKDAKKACSRMTVVRDESGAVVGTELDESPAGSALFNAVAIDSLVRSGVARGLNREGKTIRVQRKYGESIGAAKTVTGGKVSYSVPKYTKAVISVSCDDIDALFRMSDAYEKLTSVEGGRTAEMLSRDTVVKDFMKVYRDAMSFVRRHPWLTHGDGQYFNGFGTALPFWRGSGVFMYNAVRSLRDHPAEIADAMSVEEATVKNVLMSEDAEKPLSDVDLDLHLGAIDLLAARYGLTLRGKPLVDAIVNGEFEEGGKRSGTTTLRLSRVATVADMAKAIYHSYLDEVWKIQTGSADSTGNLAKAERILDMFEATTETKGEMFGGSTGINDEDMYRMTGTLPANYQIGHKIHVAIDGITNAMMSRATLANLLMTPSHDGAPVYYADPSDMAADTSGLSDEFWAQIARWWSEYNAPVLGKHGYDPALSGIQNAKRIYKALLDVRSASKNSIPYANPDGKTTRLVKYRELGRDDGDIVSVDRWLVREDDDPDSSELNALGGGEAMGYLKQFVQAGRVLGFGGPAVRSTIHRALSWSKSLSVSFSFFFPLATKFESPIGAVGAMATLGSNFKGTGKWMKEHPELFAGIQKLFGGSGWITKDFLGFHDILEMMDSNDPFLAELKSWAHALGITLSTSLVNPMEPTKSVLESDINKMKQMLRDKFGSKVAAKFGRIMKAVILRQGDKAFNYALNATKLAVVAQLAMKLRYEATAAGKAFDPVRDLKKYSGYINAEIGGIDPLRYAWAHPLNRSLMNSLMFSWQWTRGAWEAGGGGVIEDLLFGGHSVTRQEREYFIGRWCRMFGAVMVGVPMMMQAACYALAKLITAGLPPDDDDDDDKMWTWQNEDKTRWTAFDITPLLRAIRRFDDTVLGGALRRFKESGGAASAAVGAVTGGILGAANGGNFVTGALGATLGAGAGSMLPTFIPEYTGNDAANQTSKGRRYYMHFGKQGWEFFRWFSDAKGQGFSKTNMILQRLTEGIMGRNLGYLDRALAWDDMGQFERWLTPTTDSALFNLASAFLPFSVAGTTRTADAGILPIFGPVQMGASQTNIQDRLTKVITAWAHNDRSGYRFGGPRRSKASDAFLSSGIVSDILHDAKVNGFDPEDQLNKAIGVVLSREYGRFFKALPETAGGEFDERELRSAARALNRLLAKKTAVIRSIKTRLEAQGKDWKSISKEDRKMYGVIVTEALGSPWTSMDDIDY